MENGTTPGVLIRPAELRDLPLVREFWLAMDAEQRKKPFYPFPHEEDDERVTADLAQVLQQPTFVALLGFDGTGSPLGFCAVERQERRFGTPRYYAYFHGIYTIPSARTYHSVPIAVRLCLAACQWATSQGLDIVECDNSASFPPWWKGTLPFRATCSHYVSRIAECEKSLSVFGKPAIPPPSPPAVTLEDLPSIDTNVEV
jgi:hypothetical protein